MDHPNPAATRFAVLTASAVALLGLIWATVTRADSPTIVFSPNPIALGAMGCLPGETCASLSVTGTTPAGCSGPSDQTSVQCIRSTGPVILDSSGGTEDGDVFACNAMPVTKQFPLRCPGASDSSSFINCNVTRNVGGSKQTSTEVVSVTCPALARPEFESTPAAGTIAIEGPVGQPTTSVLRVSNVSPGAAPLTVAPSGLSGSLSISAPPASIAVGAFHDFTLTCTPTAAGQSQTLVLSLDTNDLDEDPVQYTVVCGAPAAADPEFSSTVPAGVLDLITTTRPDSAAIQFTVTNSGTGSLVLDPAVLSAPFSISPANTVTLGQGLSQTYTVTCGATVAGDYTSTVSIGTNDPDDGEDPATFLASCRVTAPEIDLAPAGSLDITGIAGGGTQTRTITVSNLDNGAPTSGTLNVSNVAFTSPPTRLSIQSATAFSVAKGVSATITIACSAASAGTESATLSITSNDADESPLFYPVSCTINAANAPEFSASVVPPGPIALTTAAGNPVVQVLTVSNTGNANMTLSVQTPPANPRITVTQNGGAGTINVAGGASTTYDVRCDGQAGGPYNASFTLASNDANEGSVTFNVTCTVTSSPEFASTPSAPGNFALSGFQSDPNPSATLSVRNTGTATLTITGVSGVASPFSVAPSGTTTINPNASASLTVSCSSAAVGTFSDTFTINTNDADEGAVQINASCVISPRRPEFDSTPAANATIALASPLGVQDAQSLIVRNTATGTTSLTVTASGLSAPLSTTLTTTTVGVDAQQTFEVRCTPTSGGTITQTLSLATNDPDENPVRFPVTCTGQAPEFSSSPAAGQSISLGVTNDFSASFPLRVDNTGVAPLTVNVLQGLTGALGVSPPNATIAAAGNATFTITCSNSLSGETSQTLVLTTNDSDEDTRTYPVSCRKFLTPTITQAVRAILTAQPLPKPDRVFANGFEN